ncbi:hypothetical protein K32_14730 [Kaistia sp. 32K]|uniref:hypothetical protein n=1 Tax=Kaistia sp. 32K TaxID=2795690 RepID=UPI0019164762|nr:hypothetical protein [Kaistia sp. 32K]BCP52856.1 hypothetical protein K32_14730 [Kaistia sp. 32K]
MANSWRQLAGEVGSAFGVLAILILTLLAPVHASAEARLALGDRSGLTILCLPAGEQTDPAKGTKVSACDICVLSQVAKAFGPAAALPVPQPALPVAFTLLPAVQSIDAGAALVFLPDARGPPLA